MYFSYALFTFYIRSLIRLLDFAQDKLSKDDFLGGFMIDLHGVPARKPPESPLAPQWYRLEQKTGKGRVRGSHNCKIYVVHSGI